MKNRLVFVSGLAVGYVLGARAGRGSYEKLKVKVHEIWPNPMVQGKFFDSARSIRNQTPEGQQQASHAGKKAREAVTDALHHDSKKQNGEAASGRSQYGQDPMPDSSESTPGPTTNHVTAEPSDGTFYGIGGPTSGESTEK